MSWYDPLVNLWIPLFDKRAPTKSMVSTGESPLVDNEIKKIISDFQKWPYGELINKMDKHVRERMPQVVGEHYKPSDRDDFTHYYVQRSGQDLRRDIDPTDFRKRYHDYVFDRVKQSAFNAILDSLGINPNDKSNAAIMNQIKAIVDNDFSVHEDILVYGKPTHAKDFYDSAFNKALDHARELLSKVNEGRKVQQQQQPQQQNQVVPAAKDKEGQNAPDPAAAQQNPQQPQQQQQQAPAKQEPQQQQQEAPANQPAQPEQGSQQTAAAPQSSGWLNSFWSSPWMPLAAMALLTILGYSMFGRGRRRQED